MLFALGAVCFIAFLVIGSVTLFSGSGPSPRAVLVISSKDYPLARVLEPLDSLRGSIGSRVGKSLHNHEIAYWYPLKGSDIYGVGVAKFAATLKGVGAEEMRDRYFVEVYAQDIGCSLCDSVKAALSARNVSFFSACEKATATTEYEKILCRSRT